jgi:hypothetical protein
MQSDEVHISLWKDDYHTIPIYTTPPAVPAQQEPVWIQPDHLQKAQKAPFLCRVEPHKRDDFVPLYTTLPAQPAPVQEPVAWRTFDGEGGYDYRTYDMNEGYAKEWNERNPKHKNWVEALYTTPPAVPAPVQVSPLDFVTMVMEREHLVGKPLFWAEWPNKENT